MEISFSPSLILISYFAELCLLFPPFTEGKSIFDLWTLESWGLHQIWLHDLHSVKRQQRQQERWEGREKEMEGGGWWNGKWVKESQNSFQEKQEKGKEEERLTTWRGGYYCAQTERWKVWCNFSCRYLYLTSFLCIPIFCSIISYLISPLSLLHVSCTVAAITFKKLLTDNSELLVLTERFFRT